MSRFIDYYKVLKTPKNATKNQIRTAYRSRAREVHPDVGGTQEEFLLLQKAYKTLMNNSSRFNYDKRYEAHYSKQKQKSSTNNKCTYTHATNQADKNDANQHQYEQNPQHHKTSHASSDTTSHGWMYATIIMFILLSLVTTLYMIERDHNKTLQNKVNETTLELSKFTDTFANYITIGSTKEHIEKLMGEPDYLSPTVWKYGASSISFDDDIVKGWDNLNGDLPVYMERTEPIIKIIQVGSSKQDVVNIMGTPDYVSTYIWAYGDSSIFFDTDLVTRWDNSGNNLILQ